MPRPKYDTPEHHARKLAALEKGVREFNERDYYECHETIEEVWLEDGTDDVLFLQGLIQAAAAYHNLLRGTWSGGERLLGLALDKLEPFGDQHLGVDLAALTGELRRSQKVARGIVRKGGGPWEERLLPRIRFQPPA